MGTSFFFFGDSLESFFRDFFVEELGVVIEESDGDAAGRFLGILFSGRLFSGLGVGLGNSNLLTGLTIFEGGGVVGACKASSTIPESSNGSQYGS